MRYHQVGFTQEMIKHKKNMAQNSNLVLFILAPQNCYNYMILKEPQISQEPEVRK